MAITGQLYFLLLLSMYPLILLLLLSMYPLILLLLLSMYPLILLLLLSMYPLILLLLTPLLALLWDNWVSCPLIHLSDSCSRQLSAQRVIDLIVSNSLFSLWATCCL
ncbi:hypothetical protein XELAEV_18008755mg [Xenopus laevis]|uniref:Uncharacterized protein n=1 Tax=Xenopus laevis TaxID=8355 RepID=A0A974DR36_XENLA|nr:hypothetical protein XELAEV_18008755mg [Xenopus laevis]